MFNKDLLVKTFDVIRKQKDREIRERDEKIYKQNEIIAVCLKVGRLEIYRCAEEGCDAIWIQDKYGCGYQNEHEKGFINAELMGVCECGQIRCSKHANLIHDYNNDERLLCTPCFEYREMRLEE